MGVGGGGDFGSGSGSKFNCAARVGSDDLGYGPGSGFSFEPVQTSNVNVFGSLNTFIMTVLVDLYQLMGADMLVCAES